MSILLFGRNDPIPPDEPPPPIEPEPGDDPKLRNGVGIKGIFTRNMAKGQKVTLEQAIAILKANW